MYNVYEQTSVDITFPISFTDTAYTALDVSSGLSPDGLNKISASACRFTKNANTGSILYWFAAGH